ncbi:hypothetical protein CB0940_10486 [Cercospora beticola]|uniref:EthD domain-containing protein n=1 Tax=Cercospora beticola TaxID=122368 RepID=A0A2G5HUK5_CERBT|nr:hypothetical protein CB0940_10486 [Cercospora beticola]PIA96219.1 hypothetical protein CB0940_10486 [Cercospora beticola]WPB07204.1 hypothetical protein RHO25_011865 [Cercospora beticola]CAK1367171.1 unnamed protein product [Cercospora beticola]
MSFIISVLFPNDEDAQYDIEYYVQKHMPRIAEEWAKYGVTGWNVREFAPGPDGSKPPYAFGSETFWTSKDKLSDAFTGPEAAGIMEDVKNFSNKQPIFLYGDVKGGK